LGVCGGWGIKGFEFCCGTDNIFIKIVLKKVDLTDNDFCSLCKVSYL